MAHNIPLSQELLLHIMRQHISYRCTIKLDIHEAYDNLNLQFLQVMMRGLNFPPRFVHWVKVCFSTHSFSRVINGALEGFFSRAAWFMPRGSSFSFFICRGYEVLKSFNEASCGNFQFHLKCQSVGITHLCFAMM